jgi:hypothetical protein
MWGQIGRLACMLKIKTTKMDPKIQFSICYLRKILLVCAFYKLEYLPYLAVMLPKFCEKVVYHVLGELSRIVKKNNCSSTSYLVIASLNPSSFCVGYTFLGTSRFRTIHLVFLVRCSTLKIKQVLRNLLWTEKTRERFEGILDLWLWIFVHNCQNFMSLCMWPCFEF